MCALSCDRAVFEKVFLLRFTFHSPPPPPTPHFFSFSFSPLLFLWRNFPPGSCSAISYGARPTIYTRLRMAGFAAVSAESDGSLMRSRNGSVLFFCFCFFCRFPLRGAGRALSVSYKGVVIPPCPFTSSA